MTWEGFCDECGGKAVMHSPMYDLCARCYDIDFMMDDEEETTPTAASDERGGK